MGEGLEFIYWCLAIGGTFMFVIKLGLLFMGMDGHEDGDMDFHDAGGDFHDGGSDLHDDVSGDDHGDHDSTAAFNLLSLQSIACLSMGAGWMGLATLKSYDLNQAVSIVVSLVFGLGLVYLLGKLLLQARRLESSGTLDLRNAVGRSGTVYLGIHGANKGQIQVVIQGRLITADARSESENLPTGLRVRVDDIDSNGTLIVSAL